MPYRLFIPRGYDAQKKYPLMLWLHGGGGRGIDNVKQISEGNTSGSHIWTTPANQATYPSFVLAPQCPEGEMWTSIDTAKSTDQLKLVLELLVAIQKEFSIDVNRLYVAGQSMGGLGAWSLISEHPGMFAAAIPVCGGGDETIAQRLVKTAIWAFHGAQDQSISANRSRQMIAAIRKAGGSPRYTEYPDLGHNVWDRAFAEPDLLPWVFAQRCNLTFTNEGGGTSAAKFEDDSTVVATGWGNLKASIGDAGKKLSLEQRNHLGQTIVTCLPITGRRPIQRRRPQIVGPEPREVLFASSVIRPSCSVAPPRQLKRWAAEGSIMRLKKQIKAVLLSVARTPVMMGCALIATCCLTGSVSGQQLNAAKPSTREAEATFRISPSDFIPRLTALFSPG